MIDLTPEEIEYLTVIVAMDIADDRRKGRPRTADRHLPVWTKLQGKTKESGLPGAGPTDTEPHGFARRGWRWWICDHCYAPRSLHPRRTWVRERPQAINTYLSADAPHFDEGW